MKKNTNKRNDGYEKLVNCIDVKALKKYYFEYIKVHKKFKVWDIANNILYDMCKKYPTHNDIQEIIAKVWTINRCYAAQLERRNRKNNDKFYENIAQKLFNKRKEIDGIIMKLNINKDLRRLNIKDFGETLMSHQRFVNILKELKFVKNDEKSFTSKYLHFHSKNSVYIYDSITSTNINKLFRIKPCFYDVVDKSQSEYYKFAIKLFVIMKYILINYSKYLSPREMDSFLLNMKIKK